MRFGLSGQFILLSTIIFSCDFYLDLFFPENRVLD